MHAHDLGVLEEDTAGLDGIYRLDDLNAVLTELGLPEVRRVSRPPRS